MIGYIILFIIAVIISVTAGIYLRRLADWIETFFKKKNDNKDN